MESNPVRPSPSATDSGPWPTTCPEAAAVVFQLRRRGVPELPGITLDVWASSILSWSVGRPVACRDLCEVAA